MAFLSQNNNLQELTIEESIFASDNETLKVLKPTAWKTQKTKKPIKSF
jgi:hypothetical protein